MITESAALDHVASGSAHWHFERRSIRLEGSSNLKGASTSSVMPLANVACAAGVVSIGIVREVFPLAGRRLGWRV